MHSPHCNVRTTTQWITLIMIVTRVNHNLIHSFCLIDELTGYENGNYYAHFIRTNRVDETHERARIYYKYERDHAILNGFAFAILFYDAWWRRRRWRRRSRPRRRWQVTTKTATVSFVLVYFVLFRLKIEFSGRTVVCSVFVFVSVWWTLYLYCVFFAFCCCCVWFKRQRFGLNLRGANAKCSKHMWTLQFCNNVSWKQQQTMA